ncbi:MAG: RIP metalloprotease RseP [Candidatus Kapabacteria bacterium]|nr:RIP metalloprotease RseP [Candidatus Kapabacteria bacterium]
MGFLNDILYFLIVIGILVVIHEFGHFIAARLSGIRTEIFSFGMGYRLFGYNKLKGFSFGNLPKDWDGGPYCDYRVSLFPIGGYVKVSGMVDESLDTDFEKTEPKPWEFRTKNTFQKIFVLSAGVIMNALLTVAIFTTIILIEGKSLINTTEIGYVQKNSLAESIGFKEDDKIISINNVPVKTWDEVFTLLTLDQMGKNRKIKLIRGAETIELNADGKKILKTIADQKPIGLSPKGWMIYINNVETLKPAGKAGILPGDTILKINGEPVKSSTEFVSVIKSNKLTPLLIEFKRGSEVFTKQVTPNNDGFIGVELREVYSGPKLIKNYSFFEAVGYGFSETWRSINLFLSTINQIFSGTISAKQSLGGPIMIAKMASQQAEIGVINFLHFMALLSITLAIINILPFPALDGGHLVFIIIEGIIRREIPVKVKVAFQNVGMIALLALMAFVIYNDIVRLN